MKFNNNINIKERYINLNEKTSNDIRKENDINI